MYLGRVWMWRGGKFLAMLGYENSLLRCKKEREKLQEKDINKIKYTTRIKRKYKKTIWLVEMMGNSIHIYIDQNLPVCIIIYCCFQFFAIRPNKLNGVFFVLLSFSFLFHCHSYVMCRNLMLHQDSQFYYNVTFLFESLTNTHWIHNTTQEWNIKKETKIW